MKADQLVTIRANLSQVEASVLRSLLEANGVPVFTTADHMAGLNYAVQTDLQVRLADKPRADHVLSKEQGMRGPVPVAGGEIVTGAYEDLFCPTCGSSEVEAVIGRIDTAIPFIKLTAEQDDGWFHCKKCGSRYQDNARPFASIGVALAWSALLGFATLSFIWLLSQLRLIF